MNDRQEGDDGCDSATAPAWQWVSFLPPVRGGRGWWIVAPAEDGEADLVRRDGLGRALGVRTRARGN